MSPKSPSSLLISPTTTPLTSILSLPSFPLSVSTSPPLIFPHHPSSHFPRFPSPHFSSLPLLPLSSFLLHSHRFPYSPRLTSTFPTSSSSTSSSIHFPSWCFPSSTFLPLLNLVSNHFPYSPHFLSLRLLFLPLFTLSSPTSSPLISPQFRYVPSPHLISSHFHYIPSPHFSPLFLLPPDSPLVI